MYRPVRFRMASYSQLCVISSWPCKSLTAMTCVLPCCCLPGWFSKAGSPGWFARTLTPKVCEVCPKEQFCAEGVAGGATKIPCNQGTTTGATTVSTGSQSAASCVAKPGYGYKKDATAALGFTTTLCAKNTYSAGLTQKSCTACPAGLATADVGSTAIAQCSAPAGYSFVAVVSVSCRLCASGSLSQLECTSCCIPAGACRHTQHKGRLTALCHRAVL